MPREQVNYPGAYYEDDPKTGQSKQIAPADPALHVTWSGDGLCNVQVAFESDVDTLRALLDDELLRSETDPTRMIAYSPNLERSEINKMIRLLRRARDHSYGKDE